VILRFLLGIVIGLVYELGVILYTRSVIHKQRWQGTFATLGLGVLSFFIIAALSWNKCIDMTVGYIIGGAVGSYIWIGKKNEKTKI
jgi:uncharacterized membrane protein YqgA involved in biofilm formation